MSARDPLPDPLETVIRRVLDSAHLDLPERAQVEAELRAHFEDGLQAGVPPADLERLFGDPEAAGRRIAASRRQGAGRRVPELGRWSMGATEVWWELRQAIRRLRRSPAFAAIVMLTLALGVGANTAIFTVLHEVLLEPLPYRDPGRLVRVYEAPPDRPRDRNDLYLRAPTVAAYRTWHDVFERFGALYTYRELGADLSMGERPVRITVVPVTPGYFETLGVAPVVGRPFVEDDARAAPAEGEVVRGSTAAVAVLSNRLWEELFDADPDAVGRTMRLDDVAYEVIGVMPPGFRSPFGPEADAWILQDLSSQLTSWGNFYLSGVARLPRGLPLEAAQSRATALYAQLAEANPDAGSWGPLLVPLHADVVGPTRGTMLWILAGAAALVLLTACLNVVNLVLARGLDRDRDAALRSALGSSRARILASMLAENVLLAFGGGVLGLLLGWGGVRGLLLLSPGALPGGADPELGASVFLFALGLTGLALIGFGIAPALRTARTEPAQALRAGQRTVAGSRGVRRIRDGLVVAQVAAALILVAGAALLTRSFSALVDVRTTVEPRGVLTYEVHLPAARYPDGAAREVFHERLQSVVSELPGVEAAGAVSWLPMSGRYHIWSFYWRPDDPSASGSTDEDWFGADVRIFAGGYFEALGIPLVRGLAPRDVDVAAEPVAWVSRSTADEVFGDVDPLGQHIRVAGGPRRVVGIVEDVPVDARGRVTRHVYVPHAQYADNRNWALIQAVKARGDLVVLREQIRERIEDLDPGLVLFRPRPLTDVIRASRAQDRFATVLMGALALLALTLSLVGTYGVLAGSVVSRRRELGIRMALGADSGRIRRMVLRYAALLTVPGMGLGLIAALVGARLLDSLLFGVTKADPPTYVLSVLVLLVAGAVAAWIPARRATRVDVVRVLGAE